MKLYNTLTKSVDEFTSIGEVIGIYSCGPTVYDHAHIGNLTAFITADTLRRVLKLENKEIKHVMNFTDVDDKTIRRSAKDYKDLEPKEALAKLTKKYEAVFVSDMKDIGNDVSALTFIKATESIEEMQKLIKELYEAKIAYIADDGVYLSLKSYKESGKKYGQLVNIDESNTSEERISNDEYDKDSIHDFALWKTKKEGEPSWSFTLDGHDLEGRPGWHIECSAMSKMGLGIPFDIHTGGIDLAFPHHENEIAQSTATNGDIYAKYFVHNEHLLVDSKKMSKSLNNFYTLEDIKNKQIQPLAFRLLVLQSHYRSRTNFSWEAMESAQQRLKNLRIFSDLKWQGTDDKSSNQNAIKNASENFKKALSDDLDTPKALEILNTTINLFDNRLPSKGEAEEISKFIELVDSTLGLDLNNTMDISKSQKNLIIKREQARENKDWQESDNIRDELKTQGINLNDTASGTIWYRDY